MDSISLNITTAPQPPRSKPEQATTETPAKTPKKKFNSSSSNGFTFEFGGGGHKVKAIVARKRPQAAVASAPTTPVASADGKNAAKQSVALRRKSMAVISNGVSEDDKKSSKSLAIHRKSLANGEIQAKAKETKTPTIPFASAEGKSAAKQSVALRRKSVTAIGNAQSDATIKTPKSLAIRRKSLANGDIEAKETKTPTTPVASAEGKSSAKQSVALRRKSVAAIGNAQSDVTIKTPKSLPIRCKSLANGEIKAIANETKTPLKPKNTLETPKKSIALKRKSVGKIKHPISPATKQSSKVDNEGYDSDLESYAKVPTQPQGELMLNIVSNPAVAKQPAQPKRTRMDRKNEKRLKRKGDGPLGKRTLSHKEINEGLRKFSENPNKKPRPGDLLDQEGNPIKPEEAEEEQKQDAVENADEPQLGVVDPKARKLNAFRVKRPEDSSVKKINLFKNNPEAKLMGQRLVKPIRERIFDGTKVESLPLHPHSIKNLADLLGITELTTVQQKTIPKALEGKDILVRSQTGSGKTLAYALPVVEKLQELRPKITRDTGVLAVIVVPTRELAIQTYELFQKLLKPFTWIVPGVLMGGERRKAEKARLRKGINVLIGTPGRLVDHLLHTESFKLSKSKFLVLDEADRLLEMGYERDVKQIVEAIDKQRQQLAVETNEVPAHLQRLLLSATLTSAVQKLAGLTLQAPEFIDNSDEDPSKAIKPPDGVGYTKESIEVATADAVAEDETGILTIPENLQLNFVVVPPKLRLVTIAGLLAKELSSKQKLKVIIFMSTMEMVNFHHDLLNEQLTRKVLDEDDEEAAEENEQSDDDDGEEPLLKGLRFFKLHGSMTQTERQGVFKGFRESASGVLLATDVVGRGIDVPEIDLVVQYSPPQKTADFVHRVGRTARAGRSGRAVLFLAPSEANFVRTLEDKRIRISQVDMDDYLRTLVEADDEANNIQEAASNLQHKFQELIADDKELHSKACKAFVSWMKFYSTFPKELKPIFNIKNAHMGHFAKSFGLKDQPTSFTKKHSEPKPPPPANRLTYTERDPEKLKQEKRMKNRMFTTTVTGEKRNANSQYRAATSNKLLRMLPTSLALNTSEFDSGMPALKKKKMK